MLFYHCMMYIDSMLPWVCTVKDQRRRQYVVRTSVTNSAPHYDVGCDAQLNRRTESNYI